MGELSPVTDASDPTTIGQKIRMGGREKYPYARDMHYDPVSLAKGLMLGGSAWFTHETWSRSPRAGLV